jgi:hypothetical protein
VSPGDDLARHAPLAGVDQHHACREPPS